MTTVDPQGNELVLNQCEPGEVIGELSLIDSSPRSATAIAMEPVQLLVLERQAFLDELGEHPALTMNVMRMVAARLRYLNTYIEKAIEWSRRVADGDYGEAIRDLHDDQSPGGAVSSPDEARAAELLRAFFRLVEQVRAREDALRRQVRELEIQIDEGKRRQDVETLTGTDFFAHLKARSEELRRERSEREGAGE